MNHHIRKATKSDMPQVLRLIQELANYEKAPEAVAITLEDLERDGFGNRPLFHCLVAEVEGQVRGMALFYFRYSTWKGKTVHLEDLIVERAFRGKGLGMELYEKVVEFAKSEKVKRIEWVVLDWNSSAIEFYKKTGATVFEDWDTVQFDEASYLRFLEKCKVQKKFPGTTS